MSGALLSLTECIRDFWAGADRRASGVEQESAEAKRSFRHWIMSLNSACRKPARLVPSAVMTQIVDGEVFDPLNGQPRHPYPGYRVERCLPDIALSRTGKIVRRLVAVSLFACNLAACATIRPIAQSSAGYDAIRFRKAVQVRDHAINIYTFAAGSVFIADRVTDFGEVYCGQGTINSDPQLLSICIGVRNATTLVLAPGVFLKQVDRSVPLGTFEIEKVHL